jgi:hypothetical protein
MRAANNMTRDPACHRCGTSAQLRSHSPGHPEYARNPNSENLSSSAPLISLGISNFHFSNSELAGPTANVDSGAVRTRAKNRCVALGFHELRAAYHAVLPETAPQVESLATHRKQTIGCRSNRHSSCDIFAPFSTPLFKYRSGRKQVAAALIRTAFQRRRRPLASISMLQFGVPAEERINERIGVQP